jgi:hypothetical protein
MPALKRPYGVVEVPDFFPLLHAVKEGQSFTRHGIIEPRLTLSGQPPVARNLGVEKIGPALIAVKG